MLGACHSAAAEWPEFGPPSTRDADMAPWDSAIAQFEQRLIAERTRDSVAAACAEGRYPGRPKLDQEKLRAALTLVRNGMSPTKAARHVGLGRSTLYRELALVPGALPGVV